MRSNVMNADTSGSHSTAIAFVKFSALALFAILGACAEVPVDPAARVAYDEANDPAEPTNRVIFAGNQWVDRNALQPVARTYQEYVPGGVRNSLHNFSRNLKAPVTLVNDVLQGNVSRAWTTAERFVVNSTVGGAGLFDVASDWELPPHEADFGQTFGVWGVGPGPSLQLPLLGPSNVRDTIGIAVGFFGDPLSYAPSGALQIVRMSGSAVGAVDERARMLTVTDNLETTSVDSYVTLRSMYAQRRAALIEEGKTGEPSSSTNSDPSALPAAKAKPNEVP